MATFVLFHGGGDSSQVWSQVEPELGARGHTTAALDTPTGPTSLADYAELGVVAAQNAADPNDVVFVGHSFGAFAATLAAHRQRPRVLGFVCAMIPRSGESPADWWSSTGWSEAVAAQAELDGGLTGHDDAMITYYHDVPADLAAENSSHGRSAEYADESTPVSIDPRTLPTRAVIGAHDRLFPVAFLRALTRDRLGVTPAELAAGHMLPLVRPAELAEVLHDWAR